MWARCALFLAFLVFWHQAVLADTAVVRLGVLDYGTASWEAAVIEAEALDTRAGFDLQVTRFATGDAAKVALQAGAVDLIVSDWLWVARRRAEGAALSFLPFSRNTGILLRGPSGTVTALEGLAHARIGVAGGPLDKNWLLLRALGLRRGGPDIADTATIVYGSPPLLAAELQRGRIDVLLTHWQAAARLLATGKAKALMPVSAMVEQLGFPTDLPLLGYVVREDWAKANTETLRAFWQACRAARLALARSDAAWTPVAPLMGSDDPAVIALLKQGYAEGTLTRWGAAEQRAAGDAFLLLAKLGGPDLVGRATALPPGTFWPVDLP